MGNQSRTGIAMEIEMTIKDVCKSHARSFFFREHARVPSVKQHMQGCPMKEPFTVHFRTELPHCKPLGSRVPKVSSNPDDAGTCSGSSALNPSSPKDHDQAIASSKIPTRTWSEETIPSRRGDSDVVGCFERPRIFSVSEVLLGLGTRSTRAYECSASFSR